MEIHDMHGSELIAKCSDYFPAYYALDKYPLFEYATDKELHLLVVMNGNSTAAQRLIETATWVGQMLDYQLYIHIVAPKATDYRQHLMAQCPELCNFSEIKETCVIDQDNIDLDEDFDFTLDLPELESIEDEKLPELSPINGITPPKSNQVYVHYTFENLKGFRTNATIDTLAKRYGSKCRYVFCDIKDSEQFAVKLGLRMASVNKESRLMLHMGQSRKISVKMKSAAKNANITLVSASERVADSESIDRIGRQAYALYYKYSQSNDHNKNNQLPIIFSDSYYDQLSSACAALHSKYKLVSIGITSTTPKVIAKKLNQMVYGSEQMMNRLCSLEHRRWLMYQVMQGYRNAPVMPGSLVEAVCFNPMGQDNTFRFRLPSTFDPHIKERFDLPDDYKAHTMIVPSDENIGCPLSSWSHEDWDKIDTFEKIDHVEGIDELDRVSLRQHLMCRRKGSDPFYQAAVQATFGIIAGMACAKNADQWKACGFEDWLDSIVRGAAYGTVTLNFKQRQKEMKGFFEINGCLSAHLEEQITHLFLLLSLYRERNSYIDLKQNDRNVVDITARYACIHGQVLLVKVGGKHALDQVASALVALPDQLFMFDVPHRLYVDEFLQSRSVNCDWTYAEANTQAKLKNLCDKLTKEHPDSLVMLDVTDAATEQIVMACQFSSNNKKIGVVRCDRDHQCIIDLLNCPQACVFHGKAHLRVSEVFMLLGAKENAQKSENKRRHVMVNLQLYTPALWEMRLKCIDEYKAINNFLAYARTRVDGNRTNNQLVLYEGKGDEVPVSDRNTEPISRQFQMRKADYVNKNVKVFLDQLCSTGILQSYSVDTTTHIDEIIIQYTCIRSFALVLQTIVFNSNIIQQYPLKATTKKVITKENKVETYYVIAINDPCLIRMVPLADDITAVDPNKAFKRDVVLKVLNKMANPANYGLTLVKDLVVTSENVSFRFVNEIIPFFFEKAGTPLETFAYRAALSSNAFDDVDTGFEFRWEERNVANELDVVVTRGLTATIVSCKDTIKVSNEHLYELFAHQNVFGIHGLLLYNSKPNDTPNGTNPIELLTKRGAAGGIPVLNIYGTPMYRDHTKLGQKLAELINA